ncbi:hypothetical protein EVAR_93478_1 [Eumeta japonica]|uniref:Uncharacterized protein n=1 Tax=Eumeta variegata TaxID=151549 RepID=A0A4C1TKM6_EUMVA|nr:hypothetical protein EVAR_93478_1 [Eumeta japonica]
MSDNERPQRAIFKVMLFLPFKFRTPDPYLGSNVLTAPQPLEPTALVTLPARQLMYQLLVRTSSNRISADFVSPASHQSSARAFGSCHKNNVNVLLGEKKLCDLMRTYGAPDGRRRSDSRRVVSEELSYGGAIFS